MPYEIFNVDKLPARRLYVNSTVALYGHEELGRVIQTSKEQMARRVAQMVMEGPEFFKQHGDGQFLKLWANAVVLTDDDLGRIMREQFDAGLRHASGFMKL